MEKRLILCVIALVCVFAPAVAFSQTTGTDAAKEAAPAAPKGKKAKAQAAPAADTAALAEADKVADLEAAQADLALRVEEMQAKIAASAENPANQKAIDDLAKEVAALNQKIEQQAKETGAADEALKKEVEAMAPTSGFMIKGPGESFLKVGALLQARLETTMDAAPSTKQWDFDTYLRRMRLMLYGQLNKWVNFFIETDNPNFGKSSDWSGNTFIQDAYLEVNLHEAIQLDLGMILLPFSHQGMQGATSLFAMDYHTKLLKYPDGSHKVWRDAGGMVKGLLARQHIEYRLGIFNGGHGGGSKTGRGPDPRNPKDLPRLTGRLTFNVFDAEGGAGSGGFFYDGLYLKKTDAGVVSDKRVLSFGGSIDWQGDMNVEIENPALRLNPDTGELDEAGKYDVIKRKDYLGAAWDVFWDIPLGSAKLMSLNGQADFYYYDHGDRSDYADATLNATRFWYYDEEDKANKVKDASAAAYTGIGMAAEVGFRYSALEPLFIVDFFNATKSDGDEGDYLALHGGFNYYLFGHATTFKLQLGSDKVNGSDDWGFSGKFQAQMLF